MKGGAVYQVVKKIAICGRMTALTRFKRGLGNSVLFVDVASVYLLFIQCCVDFIRS